MHTLSVRFAALATTAALLLAACGDSPATPAVAADTKTTAQDPAAAQEPAAPATPLNAETDASAAQVKAQHLNLK